MGKLCYYIRFQPAIKVLVLLSSDGCVLLLPVVGSCKIPISIVGHITQYRQPYLEPAVLTTIVLVGKNPGYG